MESFQLVTFEEGGKTRAGVLRGETVFALEDLQASFAKRKRSLRLLPKGVPFTLLSLLDGLDEKVERLGELLDLAGGADLGRPLSSVRLRAPILYPSKTLCAGANYVEHAREMGSQSPERPVDRPYFFSKTPTNTVIGPGL
jgi:2-keto-4-pentenoate hydratase/2-oxohepta-3-ene-1,7-dioic acid hydratase in catechol pathway